MTASDMPDNAKEIADKLNQQSEEKKEYLIFQGKFFYGNRSKEHGILLGIVHVQNAEIIRLNLALSTAHKLRKIEHDSDNKYFIDFFKNVSLKDRSQGVDIKLNLETKFKTIGISELLEYSRQDFEDLMQEVIEDTVQERIVLKLEYNLRSKKEMKEIYPKLFDNENQKQQEEDIEKEIVKLDCDPIIAPVAGEKVSNLKPGDEILVNINDSRVLYFKEELADLKQDDSEKFKAWISNIDLNRKQKNIVLQFMPEVYGVIDLEEDTRQTGIKVAVPKTDENKAQTNHNQQLKQEQDGLIVLSLVALLLLITGLLYFLT